MLYWERPWVIRSRDLTSFETAHASRECPERHALARGLNVRGVARPIPLECKECGKSSNYFVYPDEICDRCWRATLKDVSTPVKEHRP